MNLPIAPIPPKAHSADAFDQSLATAIDFAASLQLNPLPFIAIPEGGIPCPTCGICNAHNPDCRECLENAATELRLILLCGMSSDIPDALALCAILKPHTATLPICKGAGSVMAAGVTLESWDAYPPFAWNEPVYPRTSELALAVWEALGVTFNL